MKPRHIEIRLVVLGVLLSLLQACQSLGLQTAETFDQKWAYAMGQTTALRNVAAQALTNQQISKEDATYVLTVTDNSRTLLTAAKSSAGLGDLATAEGRLVTVTAILAALNDYLSSRGAK